MLPGILLRKLTKHGSLGDDFCLTLVTIFCPLKPIFFFYPVIMEGTFSLPLPSESKLLGSATTARDILTGLSGTLSSLADNYSLVR